MSQVPFKKLQDADWLRSEARNIAEDFAWRIDSDGPNSDWQLTPNEMRARFDSRLFDLMNKLRLFLDHSLRFDGDYAEIINRFEQIADALTEATIAQVPSSEPEPILELGRN